MTAPHTRYLICYDVCGPQPGMRRRLSRVRRLLLGVATPVQYSVFHGDFTPAGRAKLLGRLAQCIDPRQDDLRLYPLPAHTEVECLGRSVLPRGVFTALSGLGSPDET